jgi:Cu-Zn family superoxide dismutase
MDHDRLAAIVIAVFTLGCAGTSDDAATHEASAAASGDSVAVTMRDASGADLGTLTLSDTPDGIRIEGMLRGLPPGEHALHLHTVGQCQPDFAAAGDHWNPLGRQHGTGNPQGPHAGDLANITVGSDGTVHLHATTPGGSLRGEPPLLDADGGAVVIHASPDDHRTDPSGAAGDRIACGVAGRT